METKESKEWVDQFTSIQELRKDVMLVIALYKKSWHDQGVTNWDCELMENFIGEEYVLQINCGIIKTCIVRESSIIHAKEFAEQAYARLDVWKRLVRNLMIYGAIKLYEDRIKLSRIGQIDDYGVPIGENPLSPSECLKSLKK